MAADPDELTPRPAPSAGVAVTSIWQPDRRMLTLGIILTVTLVASESLAIGTVLPQVEDDLGGLSLYGWVFSAFFLGGLIGITVAGRAADRTHPWRPFAAGLLLFAAGLVAGGLAPSMLALVAARFVQGLGAGALPATAYVCVARGYPLELRPRMFAMLSTAWVVPGIVGPVIAAGVGEAWGWRWVFLGLVPLVVVAGTLATAAVRRTIPEPERNIEGGGLETLRDAVLVAAAAGIVLAGLGTEVLLAGAPIAAAAGYAGVRVLRRLLPPGTLRADHGLPAAVLLRGVLTFTFFTVDAFVPLAVADVRHGSSGVVALAVSATTLSWVAAAWVQERFVYRVGPQRLVRVGFAMLVASIILLAASLGEAVPTAVFVAAAAMTGFSIGLAFAPLSLIALSEAEPGTEGGASAALQLTDVLGTAVGTGVGGAIVATGHTLQWSIGSSLTLVFATAATMGVVGAALATRLPSALRRTVDPATGLLPAGPEMA
jgi:MFS family permease